MSTPRALTLRNLYDKKFHTYALPAPWRDVLGEPERNGIWLVYGKEKHGKTWLCLLLADLLSGFDKVIYVSAEEGTGKAFVQACARARLDPANRKLQFLEYLPLEVLREKLSRRRAAQVVVLDNATIYADELRSGALRQLVQDFPHLHLVVVAHEEKNEPYTAVAKLAKKLAKVIIRVQGLACFVSGRVPGGVLHIDEEKARLYHGHAKLEKS